MILWQPPISPIAVSQRRIAIRASVRRRRRDGQPDGGHASGALPRQGREERRHRELAPASVVNFPRRRQRRSKTGRPSVAVVDRQCGDHQLLDRRRRHEQPGCDLQTVRLPRPRKRAAARQDLSPASPRRTWELVLSRVGDQSDGSARAGASGWIPNPDGSPPGPRCGAGPVTGGSDQPSVDTRAVAAALAVHPGNPAHHAAIAHPVHRTIPHPPPRQDPAGGADRATVDRVLRCSRAGNESVRAAAHADDAGAHPDHAAGRAQ